MSSAKSTRRSGDGAPSRITRDAEGRRGARRGPYGEVAPNSPNDARATFWRIRLPATASAWPKAWVEEACRAYRAPLVFDPFQAAHVTQRLKRRGVRIVEHTFTQASVGRLAVTLYQLLREHLLDLPDDDALVDELAAVRLVERSPGSYRIDHDAGAHDDMTISVAMASAYLVERGASRPAVAITAADHIL